MLLTRPHNGATIHGGGATSRGGGAAMADGHCCHDATGGATSLGGVCWAAFAVGGAAMRCCQCCKGGVAVLPTGVSGASGNVVVDVTGLR
jgi:hypothetical protein